jgi:endo-1,4-beta-xylanase
VKRLPILVKVSLLLICFSVMLSANNAGSIINDVLQIPYVEDAPVIDGNIDDDWAENFARIGMRVYTTNNDPALPAGGAADLSAWYEVAWNEDGLYLYAEIIDDSVIAEPVTAEHVTDSWEIFIDGDNSKGAAYDNVDDVQYRWIYDLDYETKDSLECTIIWAEITGGYALELSIPATALADTNITLEEDKVIGWETQVNDAEVSGTRQNQVKWWNPDDRAWAAPSYFGTAKLCASTATTTLAIRKLANAIVMDGNLDDELAGCDKIEMPVATSNNTPMFANGGYADLSAFYYVGWNTDGIYFYGECMDDSVIAEPVTAEHVTDSWELFFDGDNSKGAAYDGVDDAQYRWIYDLDYETKDSLDCEVIWAELDSGYAIELTIPATALADTNITLEDDKVIGWEVQINDAEVSGTRQSQIKWWSHDDRAWAAPSYFGTAVLSQFTGISEPTVAADLNLSVPAIVASNNVVVSCAVPAGVAAKVSLLNVAGQVVKAAVVNGNTVNLDVSNLPNGVYLCNLKAGKNSATKKLTLLK